MLIAHIILGLITLGSFVYVAAKPSRTTVRFVRISSALQVLSGGVLIVQTGSLRACVSMILFTIAYLAVEVMVHKSTVLDRQKIT